MIAEQSTLGLFDAYGIELEYMIVDQATLDVSAAADRLLEAEAGEPCSEVERGDFAWNNELVRHVIEFKTNGPSTSMDGLADGFAGEIARANTLLASDGLRLMPAAMHPWMDPARETKLWVQEDADIYSTFDRIFSCKGHGWSNLQSMHLNLPFSNDEEFGRLHAAIRFLLPILPGLAASSPLMDGRLTGISDNRLVAYRGNCARVPSVTGAVIPEPVFSIGDYHDQVLGRIYQDLQALDPAGMLRHEWVNARGAIARFDRMALEIRVLDTQECPAADLAFAQVIAATLKSLCEDRWVPNRQLRNWSTGDLSRAFDSVVEKAEAAEVFDGQYLRALGINRGKLRVRDLWARLTDHATAAGALDRKAEHMLEHYLRHGSLATRITASLPARPDRQRLHAVYERLCECLAANESFTSA